MVSVGAVSVGAMALAAGLAAALDAVLFNPLTVRRTRAHATHVDPDGPRGFVRTIGIGLPVQLLSLVPRRAWSYALHHLAMGLLLRHTGLGVVAASGLAGMLAGGTEGLVFAPTRRIMATQQAYIGRQVGLLDVARGIVADEGWRGLWHGAVLNSVRTTLGGGAWFAGVAMAAVAMPEAGDLAHGVLGSVLNTFVVNPFEVGLMRAYSPDRSRVVPGEIDWWQGIVASLVRTVPSSAVGYWLTRTIYQLLV